MTDLGNGLCGLWAYSVGVSWGYALIGAPGSGMCGMAGWRLAFCISASFALREIFTFFHFYWQYPFWRRVWWFIVVFDRLSRYPGLYIAFLGNWVLDIGLGLE